MTPEELARALRHHARGWAGAEAGVELIIRHRFWLSSQEFRDAVDAGPSLDDPDELMACVDWEALAAHPPAGPREAQTVLAVAAALAGPSATTTGSLSSLDSEVIRLVLRAVLHAAAGAHALPVAVTPFPVAWRLLAPR